MKEIITSTILLTTLGLALNITVLNKEKTTETVIKEFNKEQFVFNKTLPKNSSQLLPAALYNSNQKTLTSIAPKKIKVMIIDSGVQTGHPELKNFFLNHSEKPKDDHGTHVAGIIAKQLTLAYGKQISKQVEFISCNTVDVDYLKKETVETKSLECFKKAIDLKVDIINYSLSGYYYSEEEFQVFKQLQKENITVVASAGNEGVSKDFFPCAYSLSNIACVAAVDHNGDLLGFSNKGDLITHYAFGDYELSSLNNNLYGFMKGTSQAAPKITALLVSQILGDSLEASKTISNNSLISTSLKTRNLASK